MADNIRCSLYHILLWRVLPSCPISTNFLWGEYRPDAAANGGIPETLYGNSSTTKATSGPMNARVGALFGWNNNTTTPQNITSRIGISFISIDAANSYIGLEIPTWSLNDTVADAVNEWNTDVFSKIRVSTDSSANITNLRLLYSSLYFMQ